MADDRHSTPPPVTQTREFPPGGSSAGKPLILVLEDDWETADAFKEALDDAGFDTVCLANGQLGLEHLAQHPTPAAIVVDLMMPVMDGWAFVNRLRSLPRFKDIPILVTTAAPPYWGYPSAPVLRKPVGRDEFIETILILTGAKPRDASSL